MKPYKIYEPERSSYTDRVSGATVHMLTNYKGHSVHPILPKTRGSTADANSYSPPTAKT